MRVLTSLRKVPESVPHLATAQVAPSLQLKDMRRPRAANAFDADRDRRLVR